LVGCGLLFQEGFVVALEKEECEIHLVAKSLDDRVAVAGISNICKAGDAFARRLWLLRSRRRHRRSKRRRLKKGGFL
jgi:hypothetical protein